MDQAERRLHEAFELATRRAEPGKREEAIRLLETHLREGHDDPRSRFLLASLYDDHAENLEAAIRHYRAGLAADPHNSAARNNLAVALMALERPEEALEVLAALLVDDPTYGLAAQNLARVAAEQLSDEQLSAILLRLARGGQKGPLALCQLLRAAAQVGRQDALETLHTTGHALKNLLGLAGSSARSLSRRAELSEDVRHGLKELTSNLEKVYGDWNAFLKAAKTQVTRRERCDLNQVAGEVAGAFPEGEQPRLYPAPGELLVLGDPASLREAVLNLARNAREASPQGEVALRPGTDPTGRWARLSVVDHGPGIAPAQLRRLFTPGFTTKHQGSGFGLAIAERIAQSAGGRIEVESQPGQGSTFTLVLPVATELPPRLAPRLAPEEFTR